MKSPSLATQGGRGSSTRDRLRASQTWQVPYRFRALVRPNFAAPPCIGTTIGAFPWALCSWSCSLNEFRQPLVQPALPPKVWTPEPATFVETWVGLGWVWHRQRLYIHIQVTGLNDRRDRLQLSFGPLLLVLCESSRLLPLQVGGGKALAFFSDLGLARHIPLPCATTLKVKVSLTTATLT